MKLFTIAIAQQGNQFHAEVPDIPTIEITGDSIADTIDKVRSAIIMHLQTLTDNGELLPQPKNINAYLSAPEFAGKTWAIISLDSKKFTSQTQQLSISLPLHNFYDLCQKLGIHQDFLHDESSAQNYDEHLRNLERIESFIIKAIQNELHKS